MNFRLYSEDLCATPRNLSSYSAATRNHNVLNRKSSTLKAEF